MDNLGGLVASAFAGLAIFVGAIALIIGLAVGYFIGNDGEEVVENKPKVQVQKGEAVEASPTRIKFDLSK